MDTEIAAIAAKAGLPALRYVSFANAPLRQRPVATAAGQLDEECTPGEPQAEAPAAGAAEAPPPAAARPHAPIAGSVPIAVEEARTAAEEAHAADEKARAAAEEARAADEEARAAAEQARAAAEEARAAAEQARASAAAADGDFPLLRAVEEQRRDRAARGSAWDRRAGGEARPHHPPAGHAPPPAAPPPRTPLDLTT